MSFRRPSDVSAITISLQVSNWRTRGVSDARSHRDLGFRVGIIGETEKTRPRPPLHSLVHSSNRQSRDLCMLVLSWALEVAWRSRQQPSCHVEGASKDTNRSLWLESEPRPLLGQGDMGEPSSTRTKQVERLTLKVPFSPRSPTEGLPFYPYWDWLSVNLGFRSAPHPTGTDHWVIEIRVVSSGLLTLSSV